MTQGLEKKYPDGLPRLDPIEDMRLEGPGLEEAVRKLEALEAALVAHPMHAQLRAGGSGGARRDAFERKAWLMVRRDELKMQMRSSHVAKFREESKNRCVCVCVLCCAVLCCAVLCCAVLCCVC